jgi:hypothetical protein
MSKERIEKELLELEKEYWLAMKDQDVQAALRLTDDPCIVTGASGVGLVDKKALESILRSATYTLHDFRMKDAKVRLLSDDVAILAYKVHEDLTVDGEPVAIDASDASTWVRRGRHWVCAMHTESITGDPFGRDRRPS